MVYILYTISAEISQGRLEALFNIKLITELTGLPIANASLLMRELCSGSNSCNGTSKIKNKFLVDSQVFPQTFMY